MATRILVVGDFSGRASRGVCEPDDLKTRPRRFVDRDELEDRLNELGVELRLASGETVRVREVEAARDTEARAELATEDTPGGEVGQRGLVGLGANDLLALVVAESSSARERLPPG